MEEYLDVNKEDFLNRNEYEGLDDEDPNNPKYSMEAEDPRYQNDPQIDIQNKYMDSEPIKEYTKEEEMTATPQDNKHFQALFRQKCKLLD